MDVIRVNSIDKKPPYIRCIFGAVDGTPRTAAEISIPAITACVCHTGYKADCHVPGAACCRIHKIKPEDVQIKNRIIF
jgi:hypothetical protein